MGSQAPELEGGDYVTEKMQVRCDKITDFGGFIPAQDGLNSASVCQ